MQIKQFKIFIILTWISLLIFDSALATNANTNIDFIKKAIQTQQTTCEQIVTTYIDRIKKYNLDTTRGAAINAFININPFIFEQARKLDAHFAKTHQLTGSLHCIPVIVKDNIDTIETPSTSGTLALLGSQPIYDAVLVQQLKQQGAIILGKGNMDELASGGIGISGRAGRTGNAFDPTQNPGGSSGGPAAAVSADFALVGIGTDNSGSIRIPAAFNGIYGLRPSIDLISQSGIFPRGNLDGVAGPLTRNVKDMAIVLSVIAKPDKKVDYVNLLSQKDSLKGLNIGIVKTVANQNIYKNTSAEIQNIYQAFFQELQKLGAHLHDIDFPKFAIQRDNNMAGEIEQVNEYLAAFPSTRENYRDICLSKRTLQNSNDCLKHIKETVPQDSRTYTNALKMFTKNRAYVQKRMQEHHCDVLIAPITSQGKATYDMQSVNTWQLPLSSNSGLPALAMTIGYSNDKIAMPIGMQFIGKHLDELTLLQIANIIEKNSPPLHTPDLGEPMGNMHSKNLDIIRFNHFITLLGMQTFKSFLYYHPKDELTPDIFNKILLKTSKDFNLNSAVNPQ